MISDDNSVPISELISLLVITVLAAVGQLVISQMTHCITLLTLVHQNIYNVLTLIVSLMTLWTSKEEVGKYTFQLFSVAKSTLQSQMSVCLFVHVFICLFACKTPFIFHHSSFIFHFATFTLFSLLLRTEKASLTK